MFGNGYRRVRVRGLIILFFISGCSDLTPVFNAQKEFVCLEHGGVFKDSLGNDTTTVGSVTCNDGTWQKYSGIELPKELWLNQ